MRRIVIAFVLCAGMLTGVAHAQEATNVRVQNVVRQLVATEHCEVLGVGSWISGGTYRNPLTASNLANASDQDMRLLLPKGTSPADAAKRWKEVRGKLIDLLKQEFGEQQAQIILQKTNFYPPSQLMACVETPEDAITEYVRWQTVPNLSYDGPVSRDVNRDILKKITEGIYGEGAPISIQAYETEKGMAFYVIEDKPGHWTAYTGLTDLSHEADGYGSYSLNGAINTAAQWGEHASDAIKQADAKSVAKYLERLSSDITIARAKAGVPQDAPYLKELLSASEELAANPRIDADSLSRINELMRRAKMDEAILSRWADADEAQQAILKSALATAEEKGGLGATLLDAAGKVPWAQLVDGLMVTVSTYETSVALGEGDAQKAMATAVPAFAGLGPGALVLIANGIIESAKDAGYSLMANSQDTANLLAGIFTAGGRPDVEAKSYTIDQLASYCDTEEELRAWVEARAAQAADRGWGGAATGKADAGVAAAIVAKCYPPILRAWKAQRGLLLMEFKQQLNDLASDALFACYSPSPALLQGGQGSAAVVVVQHATTAEHAKRLLRLREIMTQLIGKRYPKLFVAQYCYWQAPNEAKAVIAPERTLTFLSPGVYPVSLRYEIDTGAAGLPADSPLVASVKRTAGVNVNVIAAKAGSPIAPAKVAPVPPPLVVKSKPPAPTVVPGASKPTKLLSEWQATNCVTVWIDFKNAKWGFHQEMFGTWSSVSHPKTYSWHWDGDKFTCDSHSGSSPAENASDAHCEGEVDPSGTRLLSFQYKSGSFEMDLRDVPMTLDASVPFDHKLVVNLQGKEFASFASCIVADKGTLQSGQPIDYVADPIRLNHFEITFDRHEAHP